MARCTQGRLFGDGNAGHHGQFGEKGHGSWGNKVNKRTGHGIKTHYIKGLCVSLQQQSSGATWVEVGSCEGDRGKA